MPDFDSEDFAAEIDKYYEAKAAYTDLLHQTAKEQPESIEEDLVKNGRPAPKSLAEMFGWSPPKAPSTQTNLSADERYEALVKETQELQVNGASKKGDSSKNAKSKS